LSRKRQKRSDEEKKLVIKPTKGAIEEEAKNVKRKECKNESRASKESGQTRNVR
jgi:hypothetical protein